MASVGAAAGSDMRHLQRIGRPLQGTQRVKDVIRRARTWEALQRYLEQGYLCIDNVIASYYTSYVRWRVLRECFISGPGLARSA